MLCELCKLGSLHITRVSLLYMIPKRKIEYSVRKCAYHDKEIIYISFKMSERCHVVGDIF